MHVFLQIGNDHDFNFVKFTDSLAEHIDHSVKLAQSLNVTNDTNDSKSCHHDSL